MRKILLFFLTVNIFMGSCSTNFQRVKTSQQDSTTIVKTEAGLVEGTIERGITVYKGIPFAAPPTGDFRWRAPQSPKSWNGVLKANNFAPAAPQTEIRFLNELKYGSSEDCLYLNIWKPSNSNGKKLPVLVWIHGGAFTTGTTSNPGYSGEQLAKKEVIVVSIAYRLGIFGFLAHPELTAESENKTSGNYGLLDQIFALKWIQKNIESFDGNPNSVTIMGESAGGQSVHLLAASPLAKGLFHKAISMSGGIFKPSVTKPEEDVMKPLKLAEEDGLKFGKKIGANSLKELRNMDMKILVEKQNAGPLGGSFSPITDGYVIPDDIYKIYEEGNYTDIPVLLGTTSDEGTLFTLGSKASDYKDYVLKHFGPISDKILKLYPVGTNDNSTMRSAADLVRDSYLGWYNYTWATLQTRTGKSPLYVYYFDQIQPNSLVTAFFKSNKPSHGSDIPYVFGILDSKYTGEDKQLSDLMATYWTNFAKNGDPNGESLPLWPVYNIDHPKAMHLKWQASEITYPNLDNLKIIDEYYKSGLKK